MAADAFEIRLRAERRIGEMMAAARIALTREGRGRPG
jgi:hypothetical protein